MRIYGTSVLGCVNYILFFVFFPVWIIHIRKRRSRVCTLQLRGQRLRKSRPKTRLCQMDMMPAVKRARLDHPEQLSIDVLAPNTLQQRVRCGKPGECLAGRPVLYWARKTLRGHSNPGEPQPLADTTSAPRQHSRPPRSTPGWTRVVRATLSGADSMSRTITLLLSVCISL